MIKPIELTGSFGGGFLTKPSRRPNDVVNRIGGKAAHVDWLIGRGMSVPRTWVIPIGVDPDAVLLDDLVSTKSYAVRSSATVEDGKESSYAGQFATILDVRGEVALRAAVAEVFGSAESSLEAAYRAALDQSGPISMAVMIQEFVAPVASGVAFSRNPVTGLNEVVIEAVEGRGDRLVSEGHTPDRWVRRGDEWVDNPEEAAVAVGVVDEVADTCRRLAGEFGEAIDLEWVWDGTRLWWVQARPITGLAEIPVYSNRISREVMPGMIKPLVWSVNIPMVNGAWVKLFTELLGDHGIKPDDLAKQFAYRAYFNMGTVGRIFELLGMPRDSLEMLLGLPGDAKPRFAPTMTTVWLLPRMAAVAVRFLRFEKRVERDLPALVDAYRTYAVELTDRTDSQLLTAIDELITLGKKMAYLNIVTPLLANAHNALLRRALAKQGFDLDDISVMDDLEERLEAVSPHPHLERLRSRYRALPDEAKSRIAALGEAGLPEPLKSEFETFLATFGHFSDSGNDFSVPPWSERRDLILSLIQSTPSPAAHPPPRRLESRRLRSARTRAGRYQLHREVVSYHYTLGYGLFRSYFLELGARLQQRGLVHAAEDLMMLSHDEVRSLVLGSGEIRTKDLVSSRRADMQDARDVTMPEVIFGESFIPARRSGLDSNTLSGTATSGGSHRGVIRVVRGLDEFDRVEPGDIIAIPFSDVGWTPLFSKAGAVIAQSGGVLSHSSIVAREYRIPCVVSVDGAMGLPDGAVAVVNGYTGEIFVEMEAVAEQTVKEQTVKEQTVEDQVVEN